MALVAAKLLREILQYYQFADFLFANKENSVEFSRAQEVGNQEMLHIHIWDINGSTPLAEHDQPGLFSVR